MRRTSLSPRPSGRGFFGSLRLSPLLRLPRLFPLPPHNIIPVTRPNLPILEVQPQIIAALRTGNRLVLTAPPGSGKTTQVPRFLHEAGDITGRILVLQPRRLATRMVATRVAAEMNTPVGGIVGYQTRHESKVSPHTRILFLTEGLFLRRMQSNPALPGVGAMVLDEFHERSLAADMSLGLITLLQQRRSDLRLLVMSATLDAQKLSSFLNCPVVEAGGRMYPVRMKYLPSRSTRPIWETAAESVRNTLESSDSGHVLVFMPGAYEINRTIEACGRSSGSGSGSGREDITFHALHGSLSPAAQDAAVAPDSRVRKVIVSTNIAETSITIDGVEHVIDSGIAKVHRFDPRRGLNVLLPEPISQASAQQRAGRAGRTAPGACTRLWPQSEQAARPVHDDAEIHRVDLAECVLQLKAMGIADVRSFAWLDPPEQSPLSQAENLLRQLHAVEQEHLTAIGRQMACFPVHPRLSRMLIEASARGCIRRAALWAALISERSIITGEVAADHHESHDGEPVSDLLVMERLFDLAARSDFQPRACEGLRVHGQACREVERTRSQLLRISREINTNHSAPACDDQTIDLIKCLLTAFPDHIAFRPDAHRLDCRMIGRKRVVLDKNSVARRPGLLLALEVRETGAGDGVKTSLSIVTEIEPGWLEEIHPDRVTIRDQPQWNAQAQAVEQVEEHLFDGLAFHRKARQRVDANRAGEILVEEIMRKNLRLEHWDDAVEQWILRTRLVAGWFPQRGLIQYDDDDLRLVLHEIVSGAVRFSQIRDRPCLPAVMNALSWEDQQFVERMAPQKIKLPRAKGGAMKIEYFTEGPPRGRARIQELYDLEQTPRIAAGRITITLEILGPNHRPVQITDDLASFWANQYPTLRKELSRKYPRHEWR